jgi:hypothetical protein
MQIGYFYLPEDQKQVFISGFSNSNFCAYRSKPAG